MENFDFTQVISKTKYDAFTDFLKNIQREIGFKVSSRGWAYILEQRRLVNKNQFDKVENVINRCRKKGYLPVDFVAEEEARTFKNVYKPSSETYEEHIKGWLDAVYNCGDYYDPDIWEGEEYYIQILVEKIDLVTLFEPVCEDYHIAIGNAKGWSSILQRATYAKRFKKAENKGMKCVLLYCGDHDPDGLRISDTIRKNLEDISKIKWSGGLLGYDPENLIIERFGLDYDFIIKNNLTWIDNLITGSGKNLASQNHPNFNLPYLQDYLKKIGERKCEANAIVTIPELGRELCRKTIVKYLGEDAISRFESKKDLASFYVNKILKEKGVDVKIEEAKNLL